MASRAQARRAILELLEERDPGKTICPSDAARALGGDDGFRPLMDAAGEVDDHRRVVARSFPFSRLPVHPGGADPGGDRGASEEEATT